MIIKGNARGGAQQLASHLERQDTNESVSVRELHGVAAETLRGALAEMQAVASGARSRRFFYHASISSSPDEPLSEDQKDRAIAELEKSLNLEGQARVIVEHSKHDRDHIHVVWSRIDLESMTAISDSWNYQRHELVARSLETEFGHRHVEGAFTDRDGKERPKRTESHAALQQAERTGISPEEARTKLEALWKAADSGKGFAAGVEADGWLLVRGDQRGFVALDPEGGVHSVNKRVTGLSQAEIRDRLADLDIDNMLSVPEGRQLLAARQVLETEKGQGTDADGNGGGASPEPEEAADSTLSSIIETPAVLENENAVQPHTQAAAERPIIRFFQKMFDQASAALDRIRSALSMLFRGSVGKECGDRPHTVTVTDKVERECPDSEKQTAETASPPFVSAEFDEESLALNDTAEKLRNWVKEREAQKRAEAEAQAIDDSQDRDADTVSPRLTL